MCSGRTLWLDPIVSYSHLEGIDIQLADDFIRLELIQNNYGVKCSSHINELRKLFQENGLTVPRLEDKEFVFQQSCIKLYQNFHAPQADSPNSSVLDFVQYAFLELENPAIKVKVSVVKDPGDFHVIKNYSFELLEKLNNEFESLMSDATKVCWSKRAF